MVKFETPYKGGPVPLWKNISPEFFGKLSSVSAVFLVVCVGEYVFIENFRKGPEEELMERELDNDYPCYANANVSFLVNIFSMAINFAFYSYLAGLPYATDTRWS